MIYRNFKDLKLSQLGFGCMRLASGSEQVKLRQKAIQEDLG